MDPADTTAAHWATIETSGLRLRSFQVTPHARTHHDPEKATRRPTAATVVLIPGHTSRLEALLDFARLLATTRPVLAVEGPGCGTSDSSSQPPTLELYEDTLLGALSHFGLERVIWAGGSLGGHLALRLAAREPSRTLAVAAWGPAGAWHARPRLGRFVSGLWRGGPAAFWVSAWTQSRFWYSRDFPGRQTALHETFQYYRDRGSRRFRQMYWGLAGDQIGHSLFDLTASITCPVWIGRGELDNGAGMKAGVATLVSQLRDVESYEFPRARHSVETEMPGQLASAINTFLDRRVG